jgi:hypothetical protein
MIPFSKLVLLGDLRQYSLDELKVHLSKWKFHFMVEEELLVAEWSNTFTSLKALYNLDGEFIQIVEERWKWFLFKDKVFRRSKNY